MTAPEPRTVDPDGLAMFHRALPAHIARAFVLDYVTIPPLLAALEHETPAELARICRVGITRHTVNIRGLVLYRIRRTAGLLNDQEADT